MMDVVGIMGAGVTDLGIAELLTEGANCTLKLHTKATTHYTPDRGSRPTLLTFSQKFPNFSFTNGTKSDENRYDRASSRIRSEKRVNTSIRHGITVCQLLDAAANFRIAATRLAVWPRLRYLRLQLSLEEIADENH
jgi:hypothetical protein